MTSRRRSGVLARLQFSVTARLSVPCVPRRGAAPGGTNRSTPGHACLKTRWAVRSRAHTSRRLAMLAMWSSLATT